MPVLADRRKAFRNMTFENFFQTNIWKKTNKETFSYLFVYWLVSHKQTFKLTIAVLVNGYILVRIMIRIDFYPWQDHCEIV